MPVVSVIRFRVKSGRAARFEAAFRRAGMLTRPQAIEGYLGAQLLRAREADAEYLVVGRWRTDAAYAEWQRRSLAEAPAEALAELLDTLVDPLPGALFDPVAASEG